MMLLDALKMALTPRGCRGIPEEILPSGRKETWMTDLLLFRSRDFQEGIQSFLERREPHFGGN
jgi:enoyl-CoA hydratase/carnithine racemase